MPKLKPLSAEIGFKKLITDNLIKVQGQRTNENMSVKIGKSRNTYRNRKIMPESLTVVELFHLCEKEHIDIADFVSKELKVGG